jgi:drug/metabolite transporter (DMT)-like permease
MKKLSYRMTGILVLLGVTMIWGATFTLTKNALSDVDPYSFLAVRFIIAAFCLIFVAVCSKKTRSSFTKQTWITGTLLGILLFSGYIFQTVGLDYTTPAKAGFLTGLSVVLVPIFAPLITQKRLRLHIAISAFMAAIGLVLLCGVDFHHFAKGDILVLLCSVFIALQILYTEKWGGKLNSLALSTVEIGVLSILATIAVFLHPQHIKNVDIWFRPNVLTAILVCAVLATSFAYYAQTLFQKAITSAQAAIIFSMEPVFAAFISVLFNGEMINTAGWVGSILILASMLTADENLVNRCISLRPVFRR